MTRRDPLPSAGRWLQTNRPQAIEAIRWALRHRRYRFTRRQLEILAEIVFCRSLAEAGRNLEISREAVRKVAAKLNSVVEESR